MPGSGGSGGAGGSGGSGGSGGGGMIGNPPPGGWGDPMSGPDKQWAWIDFPNSRCMNDTPTGIAINMNSQSDKLFIYLEGGGACFNNQSCSGVAHQNGFGMNEFNSFVSTYNNTATFKRDDNDNPFKDWNFVFVPYCSGDVFAGNNPSGLGGRKFVGYTNFQQYLARIVPTFAHSSQVVLSGSSAGGFGAAYNYDQTAQAFGTIDVVLLDDSGPPMSDMFLAPCLQKIFKDAWNLNATLPSDCSACRGEDGGGLDNLAIYLAMKYPQRRFGLISSMQDSVIRLFYGFGYPNCTSPSFSLPGDMFQAGLMDLRDHVLAPYQNFRIYMMPGTQHTWLTATPIGGASNAGTKLTDWIRSEITYGAWGNVPSN
jgi:hypothetical protein